MSHATDALVFAEPAVCYHCGEAVPPNTDFHVTINGKSRLMCCPGCQAVAALIAGSRLGGFYEKRTAYNERPGSVQSTVPDHNRVYDDPDVAATFTTRGEDGLVSGSLLLGGISCAACTWLIEHSIGALPGVAQALVNMQQSRLDIRFDPGQCPLSDVFTRLEQLGYRPRPFHASAARQQAAEERRADLRRLAVAGIGMMQVVMFAVALHAGDIEGIEARYQALLRWVSLPVAAFVILYSARPFFTSAWRNLRHGILVMDLPVSLAIGLAFAASAWGTVSDSGQVYFDSVVMFTFLLLLGRFLEQGVRQRRLFSYTDVESNLPHAVTMRCNGQWLTTPRISLHGGETLLIRTGEIVPVDARIVEGIGAVREDTFNGEFLPRAVAPGDTVFAGTLNVEGTLQVDALGDFRDSRLAAVQRSVVLAQSSKPRLVQVADRIAARFVAGVLLIAIATGLVWLQVSPEKAFWITLSVLMVSCPCALALATPTALTSAANALRSHGIMVCGENALDALSRCTHLVLDKTGTLTEGTPSITSVQALGTLEQCDIVAVGAALQAYAAHPMALAFAPTQAADGFEQVNFHVGAGLEGSRKGITYRLGSLAFCRELVPALPDPPDGDLYWVGLCREGEALGWIGLDDTVRLEASALVDNALGLGLQVELLTGDSSPRAQQLASSLGIDTVATGRTPQQKMAHVKRLQGDGAVVAMVGDGLNDAPVLAVADASFAVSSATDLARSQADFVIMEGDLLRIVETLHTARACRTIVRQNFAWALGYNLCAMPLAACGFVPPWAAAVGMSLSSLLVVGNSLRLKCTPLAEGALRG